MRGKSTPFRRDKITNKIVEDSGIIIFIINIYFTRGGKRGEYIMHNIPPESQL